MTASVSVPARRAPKPAPPVNEFDLVESSAGWHLTVTLTDRLREAIAAGRPVGDDVRFAIRIAPNLVPGEPFEARLLIKEPDAPAEPPHTG